MVQNRAYRRCACSHTLPGGCYPTHNIDSLFRETIVILSRYLLLSAISLAALPVIAQTNQKVHPSNQTTRELPKQWFGNSCCQRSGLGPTPVR